MQVLSWHLSRYTQKSFNLKYLFHIRDHVISYGPYIQNKVAYMVNKSGYLFTWKSWEATGSLCPHTWTAFLSFLSWEPWKDHKTDRKVRPSETICLSGLAHCWPLSTLGRQMDWESRPSVAHTHTDTRSLHMKWLEGLSSWLPLTTGCGESARATCFSWVANHLAKNNKNMESRRKAKDSTEISGSTYPTAWKISKHWLHTKMVLSSYY